MELNKIVARHTDGSMVKGTTQDFHPSRSHFRVQPLGGGGAIEIELEGLKAVFFVRDLTGDPQRPHVPGFLAAPGENVHGKKIAVRFKDGEFVCGYALGFSRDRDGFFLFPADEGGNNIRIYVLVKATEKIAIGPMAEALAKRSIDGQAA